MRAAGETAGADGLQDRRVRSIDAAKGLAIALMVFGHVLGGMLARKWLSPDGGWQTLYDFIYLFHMPVFFMLSGYLLADGAVHRPVASLLSRVGTIVWPYVLWDVGIRWALTPFMRQYMYSPPEDISFWEMLRRAAMGEMAWFFWTLFLTQAIYILFARLSAKLIFAASVVAYIAVPFLIGGRTEVGPLLQVVDFMPFLALGALAKEAGVSLDRSAGSSGIVIAAAIFVTIAAVTAFEAHTIRPVRLAASIAGIVAAMLVVWSIRSRAMIDALASLGAASLVIYLLHPYFHGLARLVATSAIGSAPYLNLILFTCVALFGPYLIWAMSERWGASWLFRLRLTSREPAKSTA